MATGTPGSLSNIVMLIEDGGHITLGALDPLPCIAAATTGYSCLAMLQRRPDESVMQLLERLDRSIAIASETNEMIDEINPPLLQGKR